jgi:hypothetical protein
VWRWRGSPLCRPTDLAEAWAALVAGVLILLVAPASGLLAGVRADASLQHEVRLQQRHRVTGVVLRPLHGPRADGGTAAASGYPGPVLVPASWTAPDGSRCTGRTTTARGAAGPGDRFPLWTDGRGRIVNRPLEPATASVQAALTGLGAAVLVATLAHCGRLLVVRRLVRQRYEHLDRAWAKADPEWGRTDAGG